MSSKFVDQVSDTTNVIISGATDVASSVSHNVEEAVSSISSGVGDVIHNVSAGMKRLMTTPPCQEEVQKDVDPMSTNDPGLVTPNNSAFVNEYLLSMGLPLCTTNISSEGSPSLNEEPTFEHNLRILEDYFSEPEIFELGSHACKEDIEIAIKKTKFLILSCEESTQKRRILVQRLIQLRLMIERAKEEEEVMNEGVQMRQGHQFIPVLSRLRPPSKQFCDLCLQVIWSVLHVTYRCSLCDYQCHGKCVKNRHANCPSTKFAENPTYILTICPEMGLASQNFRCAHCRNLITNRNAWSEPRLCDYTGQYFCPACHWNTPMVSPARVLHNWDFEEQPMSQPAKHFLSFANTKPLLHLEELNPLLFKFVEELLIVKKLREELIRMKDYLRTCRAAQEMRLLRRLEIRQHFVDNAHFYSLKDLVDLNEGVLIPFLKEVYEEFSSHIKEKCEACRGKGFICELCSSEEVIFPFDSCVSICKMCQASFHENCFSSVEDCPRCIRQSSRRVKNQGISIDERNC